MNKYTIIYGFNKNQKFDNDNVILIEPRKIFIDTLKKEKFIFIPRVLMGSNVSRQVDMYAMDNNRYSVLKRPLAITSREIVYTTSLTNIIKTYDIKEISQIIINIDIDNIKDVLDNIVLYNKIIKKITCSKDNIHLKTSLLLNYFNILEDGVYEHKNINMKNPNICLFPCHKYTFEECLQNVQENYINFFKFIKMYDIHMLTKGGSIITNDHVNIQNVRKENETEIYEIYENLVNNLHLIFLNEQGNNTLDIIIQFNPTCLITQNTFEIVYPIENDILYVYKQHDIIYGNKDTMYNLYNVLKSNEFKDYIEERKVSRGKLYKFFSKNYFYEYISKIFQLHIKN
jgi:hypothetical protein